MYTVSVLLDYYCRDSELSYIRRIGVQSAPPQKGAGVFNVPGDSSPSTRDLPLEHDPNCLSAPLPTYFCDMVCGAICWRWWNLTTFRPCCMASGWLEYSPMNADMNHRYLDKHFSVKYKSMHCQNDTEQWKFPTHLRHSSTIFPSPIIHLMNIVITHWDSLLWVVSLHTLPGPSIDESEH